MPRKYPLFFFKPSASHAWWNMYIRPTYMHEYFTVKMVEEQSRHRFIAIWIHCRSKEKKKASMYMFCNQLNLRNSSLVLGSSLKTPVIELVTVVQPVLFTPRIHMHMCLWENIICVQQRAFLYMNRYLAWTTTATPVGLTASVIAFVIWRVSLSCTVAKIGRGNLL